MARFEITAPDGSRHEITAPDDASPDQVMEYAKQQFSKMPANKPRSFSPTTPMTTPNVGGSTPLPPAVYDPRHGNNPYPGMDASAENWAQRVAENPFTRKINVFQGALIPGANRLGALADSTIDTVLGYDGTFGEKLQRNLSKRNRAEDLIEKDFGVTDAPFRSLGWALGGAALKLPETAIASANYVPQAQQFLNSVVQSIRPNAAFGATQGGLDSRKEDVPGVLGDTGLGLLGGAVLGPAVPLALATAGRVGNKLGDAYRYMTGRGPEARQNVLNRVDEWKEAGIRPFAPAMTDNPVFKATGEGGVGSVFGGAMRQAAERSIQDAQQQMRGLVTRGTNGAPSSDLGQTVQDELRRALVERSKPKDVIRASDQPDLERITGPVGDAGFMPPRPVVDPIQPRNQQPFRVPPVDPSEVKIDPVRPRDIEPPQPNQNYTRFEDVPTPEHWKQPLADMEAQLGPIERNLDELRNRFVEVAKTYNVKPDELFAAAASQMHPVHNMRLRLAEAYDAARAGRAKMDDLRQKIDYDRDLMWTDVLRNEDTAFKRKFGEDTARYQEQVAEAQRIAAEETARLRAAEMQRLQMQRETEARGKYAAEQVRIQSEAEERTRRAQAAADGQWERDISAQPGLNPGVSRESYPTVFDAAYELAGRKTPGIQRNPLGRKGDPQPTALLNVLDEIGMEGRRQGLVPGYKPGQLFQETGDWAPHVGKFIDELVGPDVARRLDALATLRKNNNFAPGIRGLRDLRTAIREAADLAERPPYPGVPRKREAAALRRLEAAVTEDMYRFMEEAGPAGQAASHLWRGTDRAYANYISDLRKPLSKIFGDNVKPIEAMDRVAKAFIDGDLKTAHQFMRVMHEKGDPKFASTAVLAHITNNAGTLREFVEGISKIPPESRRVLFRGADGSAMLREMAKLESIGKRLMPYEAALDKGVRILGRGPDLTNPVNIAFGLAGIANFWTTLLAVGGAASVARFMASPRYLNWLTRGAAIKDRAQWNKHVQVLMRFADSDKENLGAGIIESIQAMQPETPQPQRKPPLPGMMRLGGPKPGQLTQQGPDSMPDMVRSIMNRQRAGDDKIIANPQMRGRINRAQKYADDWQSDLENEVPESFLIQPNDFIKRPTGPTPITFSRRAVTDEDRAQAEEYMKNKDTPTRVDDPEKGPVDVPWYEALFRESGVLPESLKKQKGPVSWLKEIDDSEVPINEEAMNATRGQKTGIPLEDVIPHQELFNIIPELKGIKIRIGSAKNEGAAGSAAFYDVESKEIVFDEREWMRSGPNERRSVLFHELQHAVDDHEGLPFSKLSEFLADTSGYRSKYDEQTRRDRPPMQIYDHKPSQYIDDVPADPRLIEGWRSHGRPIRDRAVTGNRRPPPGMMNLGGPRDQAPGSFADSPFNEMFAAAAEKGVDYRKASPQEVIDAAWAANPTDGMADAIEKAARQLNLSLPWEKRK